MAKLFWTAIGWLAAVSTAVPLVRAQSCLPEADLALTGKASGLLTETACRLPDYTPYVEYRLTTPVRGMWEAAAASAAFEPVLYVRDGAGRKLASGGRIRVSLERGTYAVWVNAKVGQAGEFTLDGAFTPDPGLPCADFPAIGPNQSVAGRLDPASCHLPDESSYDGYSFQAQTSGMLELALEAEGFAGLLIVRDSDGRALASDSATISVPVFSGSSYVVIVAGDGGNYKLRTSFEADPLDSCQPQATLSGVHHLEGRIDDSDCRVSDNIWYEYYDISVKESGSLDLRLSSSDFEASLVLLDSAGRRLTAEGESGGQHKAGLSQHVQPGNYIVRIYSLDLGGGYTFDFAFRPGLPENCPVFRLEADRDTTGVLSPAAACRTSAGAGDVYSFALPTAAEVELKLTTTDFEPALVLRDEKGNLLAEVSAGTLNAYLPAGDYTALVASPQGSGAYTLAYRAAAADPPACPKPIGLNVNSGYIGLLGTSSCWGSNGQLADYYEFSTPAAGTMALVARSLDFATHIALEDSEGRVLRRDSGALGDGNSILLQFLPAGAYRAVVEPAGLPAGGMYRLDLLFGGDDQPSACKPLEGLALGARITARLDFVGCEYPDGSFATIYRLPVTDPVSLRIELGSPDFEAGLRLLDSKGNLLEESYAGAAGSTALVNRYFESGVYYVVAKSGERYRTGTYTLELPAPG